MTDQSIYENNPLHGLSLETLLDEIVTHYGFEILDAYLNINCFKKNASIESSIKFLKKTDWAREKVESFYLYKFKSLPKASNGQFELPPRDRIIPLSQKPGLPAELSLEEAEHIRANRVKMAAAYNGSGRNSKNYDKPYSSPKKSYSDSNKVRSPSSDNIERDTTTDSGSSDPWGRWKK